MQREMDTELLVQVEDLSPELSVNFLFTSIVSFF